MKGAFSVLKRCFRERSCGFKARCADCALNVYLAVSPAPRLAKDFFDVWQILMAFLKPVLDTLDAALAFWSTDR